MRRSSIPTLAEIEAGQRARLMAEMKLPGRHLGVIRAGALLNTAALEAVANNLASILVLAGGVGLGKTLAAVLWLYTWGMDAKNWDTEPYGQFLRGRGLFLTAREFLLMDHFDGEAMDLVMRPTRLVLDDVGAEPLDDKGFGTSKIDALIDARYCGPGLTLVTTNLAPRTFEARYGVRVIDRLREVGRWVTLGDGPSLRGRAP